jgi:hypothetical protein
MPRPDGISARTHRRRGILHWKSAPLRGSLGFHLSLQNCTITFAPNSTCSISRYGASLAGSHDDVTSCRWRGCGRQADLVLPDQVEKALRIVWVDGEDVGGPPSGCLRQRRGLTELLPGVLVQWRRVHEIHVYPVSPQLKGHGVPVLDQERYTQQRQQAALTGRRATASSARSRSTPAIRSSRSPPEVAQAGQRPLQIARSLSHPVVRVRRLHPRVELAEATARTRVLQPRRTQRHSPLGQASRDASGDARDPAPA